MGTMIGLLQYVQALCVDVKKGSDRISKAAHRRQGHVDVGCVTELSRESALNRVSRTHRRLCKKPVSDEPVYRSIAGELGEVQEVDPRRR